jgi:hypothetical protein
VTPLVLLILLAGGAKAPPVPKPEKLEVKLIVSTVSLTPRYVDVRIRAYDPQHELSCPSWRVVCNDYLERKSRGLSDCEDPFPAPEDRPLVYRMPERAPVRCGPYFPGEHQIQAWLTDGTHGPGQARPAVAAAPHTVSVAGEPPPTARVTSR